MWYRLLSRHRWCLCVFFRALSLKTTATVYQNKHALVNVPQTGIGQAGVTNWCFINISALGGGFS